MLPKLKDKFSYRTPCHSLKREIENLQQQTLNFPQLVDFNKCKESLLSSCSIPLEDALIGIEIEAEGVTETLYYLSLRMLSNWSVVEDGSLRNNGKEFVSLALSSQQVWSNLCSLYTLFNLCKMPEFSWRTSVHVHMDAREFSFEELFKFVLIYSIFERSLFEFCGRDREDSPFCIPFTDVNNFDTLQNYCKNSEKSIETLIKINDKYSALNLSQLGNKYKKYGTIEFRSLSGTSDPSKILKWISLLIKIKTYSQKIKKEQLFRYIKTLNSSSQYFLFSKEVFGESFEFLSQENLERNLSFGISFCKGIIGKPKSYRLSPENSQGVRWLLQKYTIQG